MSVERNGKESGTMSKNMYSLMLMENIIKEVDRMACETNTNRSGLINRILADYFEIATPEQIIRERFEAMARVMAGRRGFKVDPFYERDVLSIKSPLEYKYRPKITYSVQLYKDGETGFGELRVTFRTQSKELLEDLEAFFLAWSRTEQDCMARAFPNRNISYEIGEGRYKRILQLSEKSRTFSSEEISGAVCAYISAFDEALKSFLSGGGSVGARAGSREALREAERKVERRYLEYLEQNRLIF